MYDIQSFPGERIRKCAGDPHQFPGETDEHQIYLLQENSSPLPRGDVRTEGPGCFGLRGHLARTTPEDVQVYRNQGSSP